LDYEFFKAAANVIIL